jgi:hypothetical protein
MSACVLIIPFAGVCPVLSLGSVPILLIILATTLIEFSVNYKLVLPSDNSIE